MVEKIKTNVDGLLLVQKIEKSSILAKSMENIFSLSQPKVVYLRPFSSLPFSKFWKQKLTCFGYKHVETGPSCSYKFATFLKYHMPLSFFQNFIW